MDDDQLTALRSINTRSRTPSPVRLHYNEGRLERSSSISLTPSKNAPLGEDDKHKYDVLGKRQKQERTQGQVVEDDMFVEDWKSPVVSSRGRLKSDMFSPVVGRMVGGSSYFPPLSPKPQSPALTMQSPILLQGKKQQKILTGKLSSPSDENDSISSVVDRIEGTSLNNRNSNNEKRGNEVRKNKRSKSPPKGTRQHLERFRGISDSKNVPIAWADGEQAVFPNYGLKSKREKAERAQNIARLKLIKNGVNVLDNLPLDYLFSKPESKMFALEKACRLLIRPALASFSILKKEYLDRWRYAPPSELDDRQVGVLVIAKCLESLYLQAMKRKFRHWQLEYAERFKGERMKLYNDTATFMQQWWINLKKNRSEAWKKLSAAVQTMLHHRRAIRHIIEFERQKQRGLAKIRQGIALRRSHHFAARVIERIIRWFWLVRWTSYRIIRSINARHIQRWRRMILWRNKRDLFIIRQVLRFGGYTRVFSKMPQKQIDSWGHLGSINSCVSMIQKAYYASKGRLDLYMKAAAKRAHEAHMEMLNEKATIIQDSIRAHFWDLLIRAAWMNNRSRRIQRGFRAHQYRDYVHATVALHKTRMATRLQRNVRLMLARIMMKERFWQRKIIIVCTKCKRQLKAASIQKCYRNHVEYLLWVKEQLLAFYRAQAANFDSVLQATRTLQWFWRKNWRENWKATRFSKKELIKQGLAHTETGYWDIKKCTYSKHVLYLFRNEYRRGLVKQLNAAMKIQTLIRKFLVKRRIKWDRWQHIKATKIWRFTKSYLLKLKLHDLIQDSRRRLPPMANKIKKNLRKSLFRKKLEPRWICRKLEWEVSAFRNLAVKLIQRLTRRKVREYFMPVRKAARLQLKKKRQLLHLEYVDRVMNAAALVIQKFGRNINLWYHIMRVVKVQRRHLLEWRMAKRLQKWCRWIIFTTRYDAAVAARWIQMKYERLVTKKWKAANKIGRNWRRKGELKTLFERFDLRRKTLDEAERLREERRLAERRQRMAEADKKKTDQSLEMTINAAWKQGAGVDGRNYYYNYVTGESSWDPPENMIAKVVDTWIKNVDARGNYYYYNMQTEESSWLPPCSVCGKEAERYCSDCQVAFCTLHFEILHVNEPLPDPEFADHIWSLVEYEKDVLKPGEVYCIECKKKVATRMCTTCWDGFCDPCFKHVHHGGWLKSHQYMPYHRAKKGWMTVKGLSKGELDYYINGTTGETTYDKPFELMTDLERTFYTNFKNHQEQAEKYAKEIEKLQVDLEAAEYAKDMLLYDSLTREEKKEKKAKEIQKNEVVDQALTNNTKGLFGMFTRTKEEKDYRKKLLSSDDRARGKARSEYIQKLLDEAEAEQKEFENQNKNKGE